MRMSVASIPRVAPFLTVKVEFALSVVTVPPTKSSVNPSPTVMDPPVVRMTLFSLTVTVSPSQSLPVKSSWPST